MSRGVILVRSGSEADQLQGLRTTLSLSLGDRQADLLVTAAGIAALSPTPGGEADQCLNTLRQLSLGIEVDGAMTPSLVHHFAEVLPHAEFIGRIAAADFVQVF